MTLYMKITRDKYELPLAVADSPRELAKLLGVHKAAIYHSIKKQEMPGRRKSYIAVDIKDDELRGD